MPELLTKEEYQAIALTLDLPCNAFVDGKFQPAQSGNRFPTINPATGKTLIDVAACNK